MTAPPSANAQAFARIAQLQCQSAELIQSADVTVSVDGSNYRLHCEAKKMISLFGPPSVILLTDDSTPAQMKVSPDAETRFFEAVGELVRNQKRFYTELRSNWALPAMLWTSATKI